MVTLFATGKKVNIKPFHIGESVGDIYSSYFIPSIIDFDHQGQKYHFELSEEDINVRPIIRIRDIYTQLYIDKYTGTLSSIRIMDASTFFELKPFDYREEYMAMSKDHTDDDDLVEKALEKQIFDLTNILRHRFNEKPLKWDEQLTNRAHERSVALFEGELKSEDPRFEQGESSEMDDNQVFLYLLKGENIAVHDLDAPAIVEGWFNSFVHRKNMLNGDFKETGIGIYHHYFVQKFAPIDDHKKVD